MEEISELKKLRKKLGLTQSQLSQRAGVSQSLIAKVESGKLDPSYSNAKKLFETLSSLDRDNDMTARDLMHVKIISAKATDQLKDAILRMKKKNISQMPVMKHKKVIGFISETGLLDKILDGDTQNMKVGDIMESSPPIVPPSTSQGVVGNLLKHFPFVLVEDKGELIGIVTKADLLKIVYN
ncbi:MAG: CBS domain-containing protein [Nanoarchaeota archaeon]|nr:CBS domain-containing protein [Nanoarchaeota archaeon]